MMMHQRLTIDHERCLRSQAIADDQPGSVLRDFRMMLDFVGPHGFEASGKHKLLPLKFIPKLDARLSRPLNLALKRPQLRSHPYLQGLYLLLRASGLTAVKDDGAEARVVVDPEMLMQWNSLNSTEQYFNLFESWLRIGRPEILGEPSHFSRPMIESCLDIWRQLPKEGRHFDVKNDNYLQFHGTGQDLYHTALMGLFGLLKVEHPHQSTGTWHPASLEHTPFGDAVLSLVPSPFGSVYEAVLQNKVDASEDEQHEVILQPPDFGVWQPLFQPYFPQWQQNLELPQFELRQGSLIFRVSLNEIWRLIAMPASASLHDLVALILHSVNFDDDHLYEFTYRNRMGVSNTIAHPAAESGPWSDEVLIGALPLEIGRSMELHYDFGDDWKFTVKLECIEPSSAKAKGPRILKEHGRSPAQYPGADDW
jgi:hypothetical protein